MAQLHMLTTIDNPFDPQENFVEWQAFDHAQGHYTSEYLARIALTSDGLSDVDQDNAIERAIDEIIKENITGMYRKIPVKS